MARVLISIETPGLMPWNRFSAVACVVRSFAEVLYRNNHDVYINEFPFAEVIANMEKENVAVSGDPGVSRLVRLFPKRVREIVKDLLLFRRLKEMYRKVVQNPRPDIVIAWVSYGSSNGQMLSSHWGVPLISIYDNPIAEEYAFQFGFRPFFSGRIRRKEKRMLQSANQVILYSPAMADHVREKVGRTDSFSIRQFIDRYKICIVNEREEKENFNFLYVGSFFGWHRVGALVNAFARVRASCSHARLYLVGGGPMLNEIRELVDKLGLLHCVQFEGFKDGEALRDIFRNCNVGVIPSALWFHAPVKLFQYAASGLCVLSCETPTIRHIAGQGDSGIILFRNEDELVRNMVQLAGDRKAATEKGKTAANWFNSSYSDKEYLDYFEHLFALCGVEK